MTRTITKRAIAAPIGDVFKTVAHIQEFSKAIPHIVKVEFLTEQKSGAGTRFKETRLMNGREASTELEVTEYIENDRVRLVSDAGGTIWDTVFVVDDKGAQTELTMTMDAKPYKFLSKLVTPLISGMVRKAIEKDMDAVKTYCEKN